MTYIHSGFGRVSAGREGTAAQDVGRLMESVDAAINAINALVADPKVWEHMRPCSEARDSSLDLSGADEREKELAQRDPDHPLVRMRRQSGHPEEACSDRRSLTALRRYLRNGGAKVTRHQEHLLHKYLG